MNIDELPFSQACENNKYPIYNTLKSYISEGSLLEIGHGTGQHAEFLASQFSICWQPADQKENIWMMEQRLKNITTHNIKSPAEFFASESHIQTTIQEKYEYIFSANTLHIMSYKSMISLLSGISNFLKNEGYFFLYGPFKFKGKFTSRSNEQFNEILQTRDPLSGIRDFEEIKNILEDHNILFSKKYDLPANNNLLVFKKST